MRGRLRTINAWKVISILLAVALGYIMITGAFFERGPLRGQVEGNLLTALVEISGLANFLLPVFIVIVVAALVTNKLPGRARGNFGAGIAVVVVGIMIIATLVLFSWGEL